MTDARCARLTKFVRKYDRKLYVLKTDTGMYQLWREGTRADISDYSLLPGNYVLRPNPEFVFALTHNWSLNGRPVEWGLEPLREKLLDSDGWRDDTSYDKMAKKRERRDEDNKRIQRNELRARASDLRKDFAKATNEFIPQKT